MKKLFKKFLFIVKPAIYLLLFTSAVVVFSATPISFDTSAIASSNISADHARVTLAAAQANEEAIMFLQWNKAAEVFSSIQVNGSSAGITQIGSDFIVGNQLMRTYYLLNPPASSVNYDAVGTGGDEMQLIVQLYKAANQGSPDSFSSNNSASAAVTLSTSVVKTGAWLVSATQVQGSSCTPTAGTGTTVRSSKIGFAGGDSNGTVGTGSQSMGWNCTSATQLGGPIVSIVPQQAAAFSFWQFLDF